MISALSLQNGLSFFFASFNIAMHTTYAMDICIETNENRVFGTELYSRYIPGIYKDLEYVRHIPDICLTYDTIRIPDVPFRKERNAVPNQVKNHTIPVCTW
jgi:hypothetical protein